MLYKTFLVSGGFNTFEHEPEEEEEVLEILFMKYKLTVFATASIEEWHFRAKVSDVVKSLP